jgi:cephalosporin hydroxylase
MSAEFVAQWRGRWNGARRTGRRSALSNALSDMRFAVRADERRAAIEALRRCADRDDLLRFAAEHIPGGSVQHPEEIGGFLDFIRARHPRVVAEIGVQFGGTNFLLGRDIPSVELVVGVDLVDLNRLRLRAFRRPEVELRLIVGDSSARTTVDRVRRVLDGRQIDVLLIDGDHSYAGVVNDLRAYRPLVADDGVVAFHDIVPDDWLRSGRGDSYAGQVPLVWQAVRRQFPSHEFVRSWSQSGMGVGVIENSASMELSLWPPSM